MDRGANIDAQDKNGSTLLHVFASQSSDFWISILLERGANPSICDMHGKTPEMVSSNTYFKKIFREAAASHAIKMQQDIARKAEQAAQAKREQEEREREQLRLRVARLEEEAAAREAERVKREQDEQERLFTTSNSAVTPPVGCSIAAANGSTLYSPFALWIRKHLADLDITSEKDCSICVDFLESRTRSLKMLSKISVANFVEIVQAAGLADAVIEDMLKELHRAAVAELTTPSLS